jgi:hypothetical protein
MVSEIASVHTNGHQCAFVLQATPAWLLLLPLCVVACVCTKNVCIGALFAHEVWYFPFTLASHVAIRQSTPDEMLQRFCLGCRAHKVHTMAMLKLLGSLLAFGKQSPSMKRSVCEYVRTSLECLADGLGVIDVAVDNRDVGLFAESSCRV